VASSGKLRGKGSVVCLKPLKIKLWSTPERLRDEVLMTRRYTKQIYVYLYSTRWCWSRSFHDNVMIIDYGVKWSRQALLVSPSPGQTTVYPEYCRLFDFSMPEDQNTSRSPLAVGSSADPIQVCILTFLYLHGLVLSYLANGLRRIVSVAGH